MRFLNNILMTTSYIVSNIALDWIYNQRYPLHAKITSFCFTFLPIIGNPIIFGLLTFLTSSTLIDMRYLL